MHGAQTSFSNRVKEPCYRNLRLFYALYPPSPPPFHSPPPSRSPFFPPPPTRIRPGRSTHGDEAPQRQPFEIRLLMPHRGRNPTHQTDAADDGHFGAGEAGAVRCGDEGLGELGGGQVAGPAGEEGEGEKGEKEEGWEGVRWE